MRKWLHRVKGNGKVTLEENNKEKTDFRTVYTCKKRDFSTRSFPLHLLKPLQLSQNKRIKKAFYRFLWKTQKLQFTITATTTTLDSFKVYKTSWYHQSRSLQIVDKTGKNIMRP
jgi:hypothetical protein